MSTLLLRLAAPLQAWGFASKFDTRDTAREPTKSGVIGLLASALGRDRTESFDDLKALCFGVRIDQPGTLLRDYHTARKGDKAAFVTTRYYLSDAVFVVALEGEESFLKELAIALQNPIFPLYLGRRSCPPTGQLVLGLRDKALWQALEDEPWQASAWFKSKQPNQFKLTIVRDAKQDESDAFLRRDVPVSFDQRHRKYDLRMVLDIADARTISKPQSTVELTTEHDAMAGLEG